MRSRGDLLILVQVLDGTHGSSVVGAHTLFGNLGILPGQVLVSVLNIRDNEHPTKLINNNIITSLHHILSNVLLDRVFVKFLKLKNLNCLKWFNENTIKNKDLGNVWLLWMTC